MRATLRAPRSLLDLADAQAGALSREQCLMAGLSDAAIAQRLAEGWRLVTRGVYSTVPITWSTCAWAGVLIGGPQACLGAESALHLLGVGDQPDAIQIWSPRQLGPRDDLAHPLRFTRGARPATGTLPRSRVEPALLDAAGAGTDAGDVVSWVTAAYRLRATSPHRLGAALAQRVRQPHRRLLQELTQTRNAGVHSPLEWRFLRTIVRAHRLPEPRLQAALSSGTRSDALFEDFGVVVELDGRTGHADDGVFRDLWRDNTHAVRAHVLTLRYGWHDCVASPCLVARQVAQALGNRGWPGPLHRCPVCRLLSPTQW